MSRQDQYSVTVSVTRGTETRDLGIFDKLTGGEKDSEELKYRPGAMGAQVSLGGFTSVGNVTVSRLYDLLRDAPNIGWLLEAVGRADVVATKQSLDTDGNAVGKPLVYGGNLKQVNPPEADSESSDAAMIEIEISSASVISAS